MKPDDRLSVALWEADRHAAALSDALAEWSTRPALDMAQLEQDRMLLRLADQILYRSATGWRGSKSWAIWSWIIWLRWGERRNRLAHEYPDQPGQRFAVLKAAIDAARQIVAAYGRWKHRLGEA